MLRTTSIVARKLRLLVERHGGGLPGLLAVVVRTWRMARVLGVSGALRRFNGTRAGAQAAAPASAFAYPEPAPLTGQELRVGIMVHMFYPELAQEFADIFRQMPVSYTLLVSVVNEEGAEVCKEAFTDLPNIIDLQVRQVQNRGRDIAPLLVEFREALRLLDVVAHVHTKKSLYTGREQSAWRSYLLDSLFGGRERIAWILGMFIAEPKLGIVYPESFRGVPLWAHTWLGNVEQGQTLASQLGFQIEPHRYMDFPAGSMFWARLDAIRPLLDLALSIDDFPEEAGQTDGTIQHAVERIFVLSARHAGLVPGILPSDGRLALTDEGARNWQEYFQESIRDRIAVAALQADIVSLDVFDTLVTRPFLYPNGARAFLGDLALSKHSVRGFAALRSRAETLARIRAGHDVDLDAIYAAMAGISGAPERHVVERLRELELEVEASLLRPRKLVVEAVDALRSRGIRPVAVSDMYLDRQALARVLPRSVGAMPAQWHVSCETRQRKDDGSAWRRLPGSEGVPPSKWLHVGDNERADIQLPQAFGYLTPVHVLRADALLDVVPSLRPLRHPLGTSANWRDQLMLGLITRRLAELADQAPSDFLGGLKLNDPQLLGYLVLGPLIADFTCWLARLAIERGDAQVMFVAREGHLLHQAFDIVKRAAGAQLGAQGTYLLASRRGVGLASVNHAEDMDDLLSSTFTGSLDALISSRMGQEASLVAQEVLGPSVMSEPVFLPEMREALMDRLAPAVDRLLEVAALERSAYLTYWNGIAAPGSILLADIGYAGTIQKLLSRMVQRPLGGAYFAVNAQIRGLDRLGLHAAARYEDPRMGAAEASAISRNDLLLETLLTAPQGQFLRFSQKSQVGLSSTHAPHELEGDALQDLARVHKGALDFLRDVCDVVGDGILSLDFDKGVVLAPLACVGNGTWRPGAWFSRLCVSDRYTGRGIVPATSTV